MRPTFQPPYLKITYSLLRKRDPPTQSWKSYCLLNKPVETFPNQLKKHVFILVYFYLYWRRYSHGTGVASITNWVDHVSDGGTPGSTALCELTRGFHPVQVCLDRGYPWFQLPPSSSAPRARRHGKEKVLDKLTFGTSCSMTKPVELSLHERATEYL